MLGVKWFLTPCSIITWFSLTESSSYTLKVLPMFFKISWSLRTPVNNKKFDVENVKTFPTWHATRCGQVEYYFLLGILPLDGGNPPPHCDLVPPEFVAVADCEATDHDGDGESDDEDTAESAQTTGQLPHECLGLNMITHRGQSH